MSCVYVMCVYMFIKVLNHIVCFSELFRKDIPLDVTHVTYFKFFNDNKNTAVIVFNLNAASAPFSASS
jgi:hypothetical protein